MEPAYELPTNRTPAKSETVSVRSIGRFLFHIASLLRVTATVLPKDTEFCPPEHKLGAEHFDSDPEVVDHPKPFVPDGSMPRGV